jgi:phosphoglycerol transferase MdoB-like AlkP superfamily enzyme
MSAGKRVNIVLVQQPPQNKVVNKQRKKNAVTDFLKSFLGMLSVFFQDYPWMLSVIF